MLTYLRVSETTWPCSDLPLTTEQPQPRAELSKLWKQYSYDKQHGLCWLTHAQRRLYSNDSRTKIKKRSGVWEPPSAIQLNERIDKFGKLCGIKIRKTAPE